MLQEYREVGGSKLWNRKTRITKLNRLFKHNALYTLWHFVYKFLYHT